MPKRLAAYRREYLRRPEVKARRAKWVAAERRVATDAATDAVAADRATAEAATAEAATTAERADRAEGIARNAVANAKAARHAATTAAKAAQ